MMTPAVQAATVYLAPSLGTYSVGSTVNMGVYLTSADQAMNAASGVVTFPTDKLQVISLNRGGSVFDFWVQDPSYSNSEGTVRYEGVVLNPGYQGSAKKILTITFKVKAVGTASLAFKQVSVLANDGQGTNILKAAGSAQLVLTAAGQAPTEPAPTAKASGPVPVITSPTHPSEDAWYADFNPVFNWAVPSGATGVSLVLDEGATTTPGSESDGLFNSYIFKGTTDGTWYAHVRFRVGTIWGATGHRRVHIDTQKPDKLNVARLQGVDDKGTATFQFDATDTLSGIDHYQITIDGRAPLGWRDEGSHQYKTPSLTPGDHTMVVAVYDRAGNWLSNTATFNVAAVPPTPLGTVQRISTEAMSWLAIVIPVLAMLFLCLLVVWYGWFKFNQFRRRFRSDLRIVERSTHQAFTKLRRDVNEHLKLIEKARQHRTLTVEEANMLTQLKIDLDEGETTLQREMKDLEKEL